MSLIGLLTVSRSFGGVKNKPAPMRLRDGLLPHFGVQDGALRIASAVTRPGSFRRPAQLTLPADASWEGVGVEQVLANPVSRATALVGEGPRTADPELPAWGRRVADPRQGELSLEGVKVVRNDLCDADLELVARQSGRESAALQRALVWSAKANPPKWKWWNWRWLRSERAKA